jgi:hypothetical protein
MENFNSAPEVKVESEPKDFRIAHKSPTGIIGGGKEFMTRKMAELWLADTRKENPGLEVWVEDKDGNRREDF